MTFELANWDLWTSFNVYFYSLVYRHTQLSCLDLMTIWKLKYKFGTGTEQKISREGRNRSCPRMPQTHYVTANSGLLWFLNWIKARQKSHKWLKLFFRTSLLFSIFTYEKFRMCNGCFIIQMMAVEGGGFKISFNLSTTFCVICPL